MSILDTKNLYQETRALRDITEGGFKRNLVVWAGICGAAAVVTGLNYTAFDLAEVLRAHVNCIVTWQGASSLINPYLFHDIGAAASDGFDRFSQDVMDLTYALSERIKDPGIITRNWNDFVNRFSADPWAASRDLFAGGESRTLLGAYGGQAAKAVGMVLFASALIRTGKRRLRAIQLVQDDLDKIGKWVKAGFRGLGLRGYKRQDPFSREAEHPLDICEVILKKNGFREAEAKTFVATIKAASAHLLEENKKLQDTLDKAVQENQEMKRMLQEASERQIADSSRIERRLAQLESALGHVPSTSPPSIEDPFDNVKKEIDQMSHTPSRSNADDGMIFRSRRAGPPQTVAVTVESRLNLAVPENATADPFDVVEIEREAEGPELEL